MVTSGFIDTPEVAATREWLAARDSPARSGIGGANVHFCRRRPDKRAVCEGLGISGFIDHPWTVFQHLVSLDE